jgi:hypothetical protein
MTMTVYSISMINKYVYFKTKTTSSTRNITSAVYFNLIVQFSSYKYDAMMKNILRSILCSTNDAYNQANRTEQNTQKKYL